MTAQYANPVTVNHVTSSDSQFVGRQRELTLIWNQYKAAQRGHARVVLLVGELGIGKTRLLNEFAALAVEDGATALQGGASEYEGMPPYLPFLEALGQHIRVTPVDQLREQVAVAPQALANILPELSVRLGELPATYPLPSEQERLRLYEAIGGFLETISASYVLVLTLDDLQWADSASLDLLCYIVQHQSKAKLMVVGTYRESEIDHNPALGRAVTELARQRLLTTVTVGPLSAGEIEALAVRYLGGSISPIVSKVLHVQSEGNPFFAEELIQEWIEVGALVEENKCWVAVAPLEQALPSNIAGALRQRFARLSPDIIDHLRIAAIIGRTFDLSLLATVEGQEVEHVEECLLEAERARLVQSDQTGVFTFNHDKIRESLYAEVSTSRRRRLHETIGRILEDRYDHGNIKSIYQLAELAFHFARSGDRVRGATYSQLAAEQALRSSAIQEAIAHYQMALKLLDPDDKQRGNLLLSLSEATLLAGNESETALAYEDALTWLLCHGEVEVAARAAHSLGLVQWRRKELPAARLEFERALELQGGQQSALVGRVLVDLAMLLTIYMDDQAKAKAYAQRALEIAYNLRDISLEAAASRVVSVHLYMFGNDSQAVLHVLERALALVEESDDPSEAAECCLYLSGAYYWMAEVKRSYEMSLRRMKYIERCQQPYLLQNDYAWLALLHASWGEWAEAEQAIARAHPLVDRLSNPFPLAFLHQIRGFFALQREDYPSAERELQNTMVNQQQCSGMQMVHTGLLGIAQVARGKHKEAFESMMGLEQLLANLPTDTLPAVSIMTCLALIALALNDRQRVANLYPKLLAFRSQYHWFLVDRVLGEMALLNGDCETATIHLSEAESIARHQGLRPELTRILMAQANVEMARGGQGSDTSATNFLRQAQVLSEELTMIDAPGRIRSQLHNLSSYAGRPTQRSLPARLTKSEAKVLQLVVQGKSNRQIAQDLGISEKTVANHLSHIFSKTKSGNRAAATAFAIHHGLA